MKTPLRIGVVGFGGFARYAIQNFIQVDGVELKSYGGTHNEAAIAVGQRFGLGDPLEPEQVWNHPDVDLVYIATPPFLHFEQSKAALLAGKHVICEKPLAMRESEARELADLGKKMDRLIIANMMQRYNPLLAQVEAVIQRKLLGEPLYARLENMASDEALGPDHWFWDPAKSGGIFIEHGVHFFDMFAMLFGPGTITSAQRRLRPGTGEEEQVSCMGVFGETEAFMLHSFTNPSRMDRQEFRFVFERGEIVMEEWVPTRARIVALADPAMARELTQIFPHASVDASLLFGGPEQSVHARGKDFLAEQLVTITVGAGVAKYDVYGKLLRSLLADQMGWIADHGNRRRLTDEDGVQSVALAERATELARGV